jgi:hypothetical protein
MRVLPLCFSLHLYSGCCGKTVCGGCYHQHRIKANEANAKREQKKQPPLPEKCAFCRTTLPDDEEYLAQLRKRVELNDPDALYVLASNYGGGGLGLPVDQTKCIELLRESADLGNPYAQYHLGDYHRNGQMGLEQNEEEALKCFKESADGGHVIARHLLACMEDRSDKVAAMHHARLSASGGYKKPIEGLIACFEDGLLRHGSLAETLQAFYRSKAERKSNDRDHYIEHLKKTGHYKALYED